MAGGRLILLASLTIGTLISCSNRNEHSAIKDGVDLMAELNCEAVELRKARFELADRIRFIQDTLMLPDLSEDHKLQLQLQLNNLEPYKDSIVTRSLELAKVIKFKLDSLIENELDRGEQRQTFDAELSARLKELGCE